MDFGFILSSIAPVFEPGGMLFVFIGALAGILIGSIPGLTSTMGIALLVPFTYGMSILPATGMLLGLFCGAMYGGSIAAILIHTPGTPSAAATVLDGYPMSMKGEAGRALAIALFASFCGGIIGAISMTFLSPFISRMALKFGPAEFFTLAVFGLSVIVSISGKSILKGLISAFFGLLLCTIGMDKGSGYLRFTRLEGFYDGVPFIPALVGLFAVSEVFANLENILSSQKITTKISGVLPSLKDLKLIWPTILKSGVIGMFVGSIPGAGGDIAAFISYSEAKRASKHPEEFGHGAPEGVAAAEASNNACSGGAMIPMLALGVPGDSNTAVLVGAFIMQGFQPGPMMYVEHLDIVYSIFAAMITANIAMLIVGGCGVKLFAKVISIDKKKLLPVILVLSLVGAYSINGNLFDASLAIVMGLVGYLLQKYEFPLSPILLALILGPMSESNLRRFMQIHDSKFWLLFTRPICVVLIILAVASLVSSVINQKKIERRTAGSTTK